ncbi:MAG TPA: N-acetylmuramoyl-L-alanine amidase [Sedimentisphaerales bacterium]|nr:N-acetylmuramoyl-L-alanine amidase [Sedimentisphaerales bacterium]
MANQPRVAKVLAALLVSMTAGAIVLMALGNNAPSAGPFCLSSYYHLNSIEQVITSKQYQSPQRWNNIKVCYSGTGGGSIEQLASLNNQKVEDLNCHFVIFNGSGGIDGEILATEKWQRQWAAVPGSEQTILVCVVADGMKVMPTELQIRRTEALLEDLSRKFNITPISIIFPKNWLQ